MVGLSYILLSKEAKKLKQNQYSHGIDYLGSRQGSWLLKRLGIKKRYGIRGYAGGDNLCTKYIEFKINQHVSKTGINFLKLVNQDCTVEIDPRPQIYLTEEEKNSANSIWNFSSIHSDKIVIAPGAGFPEKSWGDEFFVVLIKKILDKTNSSICVIGSSEDKKKINITHKRLLNLCGQLKLRESAALVSESDFLISNSSLAMHLAGAFHIPSITTLGPCYDSAQLHHKQWGYDENLMLGKEINQNRLNTYKPEEVFSEFSAYFHKNIYP